MRSFLVLSVLLASAACEVSRVAAQEKGKLDPATLKETFWQGVAELKEGELRGSATKELSVSLVVASGGKSAIALEETYQWEKPSDYKVKLSLLIVDIDLINGKRTEPKGIQKRRAVLEVKTSTGEKGQLKIVEPTRSKSSLAFLERDLADPKTMGFGAIVGGPIPIQANQPRVLYAEASGDGIEKAQPTVSIEKMTEWAKADRSRSGLMLIVEWKPFQK